MATTTVRTRRSKVTSNHPLAALIPPMVKATEYVSRQIRGVWDIDLLRYARDAKRPVIFSGDTGAGKTHLIEAFAATEGLPLVMVEFRDGIDPNTFFGQWVPKADLNDDDIDKIVEVMGKVSKKLPKASPSEVMEVTMALIGRQKFTWRDSEIVTAVRHGNAVIDLAEVNFGRGRVTAAFHRLLRNGILSILETGETIIAGPGLLLVADYNPDYDSTFPLNAAFKNRFPLKVPFPYDRNVETELVGMPVLLDIADLLRASHKDGELQTPISTNMLVEFEEFAIDLGLDFAIDNFVDSFHADESSAVRETLNLHRSVLDEQLVALIAIAQANADQEQG